MAPGTIQRSDAEDDSVLLEPKSTNALTVENLERLQRYLEYFEVLKESRYGDPWLTDPLDTFVTPPEAKQSMTGPIMLVLQ